MNAGKRCHWEKLRFVLSLTGSATEGATGSQRAILMARRAENSTSVQADETEADVGLSLVNPIGGGDRSYSLYLSGIGGGSYNATRSGSGSMSSYIEMDEARFYFDGSGWLVEWDEMKWFVEGDLEEDLGAGSASSAYFAPAGLPLLGLPTIRAGATSDGDLFTVHDWTLSARATGGFRFRRNGLWEAPPIQVSIRQPTGAGDLCPYALSAPLYGGETSDTAYIEAYRRTRYAEWSEAEFECDDCPDGQVANPPWRYVPDWQAGTDERREGDLGIFLKLPRRLIKTNSDYGLVVERFPLPAVDHKESGACQRQSRATACDEWTETSDSWESSSPQDYRVSGSVALIEAPQHPVESPTTGEPVCWYRYESQREDYEKVTMRLTQLGACEIGGPEIDYPTCCPEEAEHIYNRQVTVRMEPEAGEISAYLDHPHPMAKYANSRSAPWWSFATFWPNDADENFWLVGNPLAKADSKDYWLKLRQQYFDHDRLPESERTRRRNFVISESLLECAALSDIVKNNYTGVEGGFVGVSAFQVEPVAPVASFALSAASEDQWQFSACTAAFGASSIVLTPSASSFEALYLLGQFADPPYLYPHVCSRFQIGWSATNVASCRVYLQSYHGRRVLLAASPGVYDRPTDNDDKYVGSWAQDLGLGEAVDFGSDSQASGESLEAMDQSERISAYEILTGDGAAALVFVIEVEDTGETVSIDYPVFLAPAKLRRTVQENANVSLYLETNGAGLRFGQWDVAKTDESYIEDERGDPVLRKHNPPDEEWGRATWLDWAVWKRHVLQAKGKTEDLATEIAARWDETEGRDYAALKADSYTIWQNDETSEGVVCLSFNGLAQFPPVANLPTPVYDQDDWTETGDYHCGVYSTAAVKRRIVNPRAPLRLYEADDLRSAPEPTLLSGWKIEAFDGAVDNDETTDAATAWTLRIDGLGEAARVSPWHGWLGNVHAETTGGLGAVECLSPRGLTVLGSDKRLLAYDTADFSLRQASDEHPVDRWISLDYDRRQEVLLALAQDGGETVLYRTLDAGIGIEEILRMTADNGAVEVLSERGLALLYWADGSGGVWRRASSDGGQTWGAASRPKEAGGDMEADRVLDAANDCRNDGVLLLLVETGGAARLLKSYDAGLTFELAVA